MKSDSPHHDPAGYIVGGAWLMLFAGMLIWWPHGYVWLTYEDCLVEWAQALYCLTALMLFVVLVRRGPAGRKFYLLMAVGCVYLLGEELSWGQRLLGFEVPELFIRGNLQQETNLHNFLIGPYGTLIKHVSQWGLAILFGCCGVVILFFRPDGNRKEIYRLIPYWPARYLGFYLLASAVLELEPWAMNESEWAETLIYFSLVSYALYCYRRGREVRGQSVMLMFVGLALAGMICAAMLARPVMAGPVLQRLENGKRLFVERYQQKGWLLQSDQLLDSLLDTGADKAWVLRAQAKNQRLREPATERWKQILQRAVDYDLEQLRKSPQQVSRRLSLFEDYAQLGQRQHAEKTLTEAVESARVAVENFPESGESWYWLGQIYVLVGKRTEAMQCFERAAMIDPQQSAYRQIIYSLSHGSNGIE